MSNIPVQDNFIGARHILMKALSPITEFVAASNTMVVAQQEAITQLNDDIVNYKADIQTMLNDLSNQYEIKGELIEFIRGIAELINILLNDNALDKTDRMRIITIRDNIKDILEKFPTKEKN